MCVSSPLAALTEFLRTGALQVLILSLGVVLGLDQMCILLDNVGFCCIGERVRNKVYDKHSQVRYFVFPTFVWVASACTG